MNKLSIAFVLDGSKKIAVEITDGEKTWFYELDQAYLPGMRIGPFPRKSLDEDYIHVPLLTLSDQGAALSDD